MKTLAAPVCCVLLISPGCDGVAAALAAEEYVPPPNTALLWYPFDGWWAEFPVGIEVDHLAGTPIPVGYDVWVGSGWVGRTYGLVKTMPNCLQYSVDIPGVADLDFRQSRAYWKAPYMTDDLPGFNPHIGAKT